MNRKISRKELSNYLSLLRETLRDDRNFPPPHVIFFNSRSFYNYVENCICGDSTIGEVLKKMETCVPLALTDHSLQLFLRACKAEDVQKFSISFLESSKADFLLLIRSAAHDEDKWQAVLTLCDGLRLQNK